MSTTDDQRQVAIKRLNAKRDFRIHLVVYILVNALLIMIWAVSGAGYFWPIWPLAGWGIGLALHGYNTYGRAPITEDEIQAEMRRHGTYDGSGQ